VAKVFVSHSGRDSELSAEVRRWLTDAGHEVFLDRHPRDGIELGDEWRQRLHERLRWADAVVCLVTSAYESSIWCAMEIGIARERGCRLLPMTAEPGVRSSLLREIQHTDLTRDRAAARDALLAALVRVEHTWPDDKSPFPGLDALDSAMRQVFFGRSADVVRLLQRLRSTAGRADGGVLLVVGPSGCGKSSLVRAGLLLAVAEELRWRTLEPMLPGTDPVAALVRVLSTARKEAGLEWEPGVVRRQLLEMGLATVADGLLRTVQGAPDHKLLLVVDQCEELLAPGGESKRAEFARLVRPALGGPVQVVATLRPEFLGRLMVDRALADLPFGEPFLVRPLSKEALAGVIEGPARVAGIEVHPDLVTELVSDTASGEALPLLAFTLAQLAEGVSRGGALSMSRYDELGGVRGALTKQADAALTEALSATGRSREQVMDGLLQLVTVDEQGRQVRRRVNRAELPEPVDTELAAFVARRLLTTDTVIGTDREPITVIGVAHEAFLQTWSPLRAAIDGKRSSLRARREVELAAGEWDQDGRPGIRLWERSQLAAAVADTGARPRFEQWPGVRSSSARSWRDRLASWLPWTATTTAVTDRITLSATALSFLGESMHRDRWRRRRAITILSALLALALVAAGIAFVQQRVAIDQQRLATARLLMAQAEASRTNDPRIALLLGITADRLHPDDRTRASLVASLTSTHYAGMLTGHTSVTNAPVFTSNGRIMATGGIDGQVILWDVTGPGRPRQLGQPLTSHPELTGPRQFSPDGRILATHRSPDDSVVLWDVRDPLRPRQVGQPLTGASRQFTGLVFAPDGKTLAIIGNVPGTVVLWDVSDPAAARRLGQLSHGVFPALVAFYPDGHTLLTAASGSEADHYQDTVLRWDIGDLTMPRPIGQPLSYDYAGPPVFDQGRRLLAMADEHGGGVGLWDMTDPANPRRSERTLYGAGSDVNLLQLSPDGHTLAICGYDSSQGSQVRLWDLTDPNQPRSFEEPPPTSSAGPATYTGSYLTGRAGRITTVEFLPGRPVAVTVASEGPTLEEDQTLTLWDLSDRAKPGQIGQPIAALGAPQYSVGFFPDGRTVATGRSDGSVLLWDLRGDSVPGRIGMPFVGTSPISSMEFSPDGRTLLAGRSDGSLDQRDLTNPAAAGPAHQLLPATGITYSEPMLGPAGRLVAERDPDGRVTVLDPLEPSGRGHIQPPFFPGKGGNGVARPLGFSPDGKLLALGISSWGSYVTLWDVTDPVRPHRLGTRLDPLDFYAQVAFAPDGRTLASVIGAGSPPGISLIDISDPAKPAALGDALVGHTDVVRSVGFSPNGRLLASGSADRTVILWDVADPRHPRRLGLPLTGHTDEVTSVRFSPDSRILASGGDDGKVVLWDLSDLAQPRPIGSTLAAGQRSVRTLVFSVDGQVLVTGDTEGIAVAWGVGGISDLRDHPADAACARTGRGLDRAEWARYVPGLSYQDTCPS
jgi:WD40 repeat protein/energy-coupling factor transporter ATP-binding protein EcfA2